MINNMFKKIGLGMFILLVNISFVFGALPSADDLVSYYDMQDQSGVYIDLMNRANITAPSASDEQGYYSGAYTGTNDANGGGDLYERDPSGTLTNAGTASSSWGDDYPKRIDSIGQFRDADGEYGYSFTPLGGQYNKSVDWTGNLIVDIPYSYDDNFSVSFYRYNKMSAMNLRDTRELDFINRRGFLSEKSSSVNTAYWNQAVHDYGTTAIPNHNRVYGQDIHIMEQNSNDTIVRTGTMYKETDGAGKFVFTAGLNDAYESQAYYGVGFSHYFYCEDDARATKFPVQVGPYSSVDNYGALYIKADYYRGGSTAIGRLETCLSDGYSIGTGTTTSSAISPGGQVAFGYYDPNTYSSTSLLEGSMIYNIEYFYMNDTVQVQQNNDGTFYEIDNRNAQVTNHLQLYGNVLDTEWIHYVFTFNSGTMKTYVEGSLVDTTSLSGFNSTNNLQLVLGGDNLSPGSTLNMPTDGLLNNSYAPLYVSELDNNVFNWRCSRHYGSRGETTGTSGLGTCTESGFVSNNVPHKPTGTVSIDEISIWDGELNAQEVLDMNGEYYSDLTEAVLYDIISYHALEEESAPYLDSYGLFDMTSASQPTATPGKIGNGQDFNSNVSNTLTTASSLHDYLDFDETWSINMWILEDANTTSDGIFYGSSTYVFNTTGTTIDTSTATYGANYTDGAWRMMTWTYEPFAGQKIYIDGTLVATGDKASSTYKSAVNFAYDGINYNDMMIDEVGWWARELTSGDIDLLYNSGAGRSLTQLGGLQQGGGVGGGGSVATSPTSTVQSYSGFPSYMTGTCSYSDATGNIVMDYNDPTQGISYAELNIYTWENGRRTYEQQVTSTAHSDTLTIGVSSYLNNGEDVQALAYINTTNTESYAGGRYMVCDVYATAENTIASAIGVGNAVGFGFFILLAFLTMGLMLRSAVGVLLFGGAGFFILTTFFLNIGQTAMYLVVAMIFIILWGLTKR